MSITADGLYSVSYTTTKIGNIGTGFHLTMSGKEEDLPESKKTVNIVIKEDYGGTHSRKGILGHEKGISLTSGETITRTYEGITRVITDPLNYLLSRVIIITNAKSLPEDIGTGAHGLIEVFTSLDLLNAYTKSLQEGDMTTFVDMFLTESTDIAIDCSKSKNSPILRAMALNKSGKTGQVSLYPSVNTLFNGVGQGGVLSVMDIFSNYIAPLGLEFYWNKNGTFTLEPPRIMNIPEEGMIEIKKEEIVSLDSSADPYNMPTVVIPNYDYKNLNGYDSLNIVANRAIRNGSINQDLAGKNLKVSTYSIPPILTDAQQLSEELYKGARNKSVGQAKGISPEFEKTVHGYLQSYALKSNAYAINTGQCVCYLRPDIVEADTWYLINGEKCFVTEVSHRITRTGANTILSIGGKEDKKITSILSGYQPKLGEIQESKSEDESNKEREERIKAGDALIKSLKEETKGNSPIQKMRKSGKISLAALRYYDEENHALKNSPAPLA